MLASLWKSHRQLPLVLRRGSKQDFRLINHSFEWTKIRLYSSHGSQKKTSRALSPRDMLNHTPRGTHAHSHQDQPPSSPKHKNKRNNPKDPSLQAVASVPLRSRVVRLKGTHPLANTDSDSVFKAPKADAPAKVLHREIAPSTKERYPAIPIVSVLPDDDTDLVSDQEDQGVPQGCPNHPPMLTPPNNKLASWNRHGHADFDRYLLAHFPAERARFVKWKHWMIMRYRRTNLSGRILSATPWAFARRRNPFTPRYALRPLPSATAQHLLETKRTMYPEFIALLEGAAALIIGVEDELVSPGLKPSDRGCARTYACRIVEVDGREPTVACPDQLCVKIYDDSIAPAPDLCSRHFRTEEEALQTEEDVYMRLRHAWGSAVPYYYGSHLLACPDGRSRYCTLTEFIPDPQNKTSPDLYAKSSQIALIQSARHALRVLQYADVSGFRHVIETVAWVPKSRLVPQVSCTLAGFEHSRQGTQFLAAAREDDYAAMVRALTRTKKRDGGLPKMLVEEHFAPREPWDTLASPLP